MKFLCAEERHVDGIYYVWKQTKQRILGLPESIKNKMVYVFIDDFECVIGFIRIAGDAGLTLDYLKINELIILKKFLHDNDALIQFFDEVDKLILGFGYTKAQVTSIFEMTDVLSGQGWKKVGEKFKFSKDGKSYSDYLYIRAIGYHKDVEKIFGRLII